MLDENTIYDTEESCSELMDNYESYLGRLFSIRVMNLDGVYASAYYTTLFTKIIENGAERVGFLVLCDDTKKTYLDKLLVIDPCFLKSFTLFSGSDAKWYDRFLPYLPVHVATDFMCRVETKNGDVSISINNDSNVLVIKQGQTVVELN